MRRLLAGLIVMGALFLVTGAPKADAIWYENEPNNSLAEPMPLDPADWSLNPDNDIGDALSNTSAMIPHVTVYGSGDNTLDYFSVYAPAPGTRIIVDIDYANFDSYLRLLTPSNVQLAIDDDGPTTEGQGGSMTTLNSFIDYAVPGAGVYIIEVGSCCPGGAGQPGAVVFANLSYYLQVSIEGHAPDLDRDRIGQSDLCPSVAEDADGYQDTDGCPEPDDDGDGICDSGQTAISCIGSDNGWRVFDPAGTLPTGAGDCRSIPEDLDGFRDGDGCPEPDNDNDSFPDATDACPGADASAGIDGMFGAPQDANHNGVRDGAEAAFTTDDVMPLLMWEDKDGVLDTDGCHDSPGDDFDGDGLTDDAEVFTHLTDAGNPDTDADTVIDGTDNCPNWPNMPQNLPTWGIPATDSDCDGFTVAREQYMGTNPTKHCPNTATANDEAVDAWPSDFNDNRFTTLQDVILMGPAYNQATGTDPAKRRFDINANGFVTLQDVILLGPFYNKTCG